MNVLLTGVSGYIGSQLLPALQDEGLTVRASSRREVASEADQFVVADMLTGQGLDDALDDIEVAFYLVHSMAGKGDFAAQDRKAAENFAVAAQKAGVRRVIYLGGLGDSPETSKHLTSRQETADILAEAAPEFVYARAAVVLGQGSASFRMLTHLVHRLPVMVCPRWIDVKTQPIAISDIISSLVHCATLPNLSGQVQLGGRDIVSYREMMITLAQVEKRPRPMIIPVPVLTPKLSSYWVGLVTDVDVGIARPLIEGLKTETVVTVEPPTGINDNPLGLEEAMRLAVEEKS